MAAVATSQDLMDASLGRSSARKEAEEEAAPCSLIDRRHASSESSSAPDRQFMIRFVDHSDSSGDFQELPLDSAPEADLARFCDSESALDAWPSLSEIASEFQQNLRPGIGIDQSERDFFGRRLILDIGGTHFKVPVDTLCKDSESALAASVRYHIRQNKEQEIYYDRDANRFAHVLNYLRDGRLWLDDLPSLRGICDEADYYNLQGLRSLCLERIDAVEAKQEADSRRKMQELEEAFKRAFFNNEKPLKHPGEIMSVIRARVLGASAPVATPVTPRFELDEDF